METIREYLVAHPEVDEVILSGGDPLTLTDAMLERWLVLIRSVSSVVRIRIHTRVPVNLPSRITNELVEMLAKYQDAKRPVIVVTHFNHVREIAEENVTAIARMVDHGIVVRNQSVLLRGVNDSVEVLEELCAGLTNIRVQPYYIHQLDLAKGTNHFRVPLVEAMDLMARLQGRVSGVALPRLMVSLPNGKGKVQAMQTCFEMVAEGKYRVKTWEGEVVEYCEPNERVTGN
jgi:lysine 2,3-aminomutase